MRPPRPHPPSHSVSLLRYLLGRGCGYWLCHFFISILLLICPLSSVHATRQGGRVHVFHCASVCLPVVRSGGVGMPRRGCQRTCNTQALDWLEPCSSMTLISRVQAREGGNAGELGFPSQLRANMTRAHTLTHIRTHTRCLNAGRECKQLIKLKR